MFLWTKLPLAEDAAKTRKNPRQHPQQNGPMTVFEALSMFGVTPEFSKEQLREIYRSRIAKCHPDRVHSMDNDFKELAEEKSKTLNEAYRMLLMVWIDRQQRRPL